MTLAQPRIRVVKSLSTLDLFDGTKRIKTYRCITGTHSGDKQHEGDRKTPEGLFRVVFKNPHSKFHLSLGLNYPNEQHAGRGLAQGLLTVENYNQLMHDLKNGDMTDKTMHAKPIFTPGFPLAFPRDIIHTVRSFPDCSVRHSRPYWYGLPHSHE